MTDASSQPTRALVDRALIEAAWADAAGLPPQSPVVPPMRDSIDESVAECFPGYDLLREIHRGGQGVVYQAIQKSTRRKVAVKVMREGPFAGTRERARFEREVQILGALSHPNIVAIHDSGEVRGSFYYVMDYIAGKPLDEYIEARRRDAGALRVARASSRAPKSGGSPSAPPAPSAAGAASAGSPAPGGGAAGASGSRSRGSRRASQEFIVDILRLFAKICDALNAAHLRGVIHRDLKPANIRVDEHGEPFVLDFGLAKLALGGDHGSPIVTATGQFIGSLPWASPEQTGGSPNRVDIRSDVYSLGVILYQMLTGQFPYVVSGAPREVLENIATVLPDRPSSFDRQIDDEVETIVLKCLQKDAARRYQSAGELGRDIQHYLAREPIEAKRDSALYVIRKAISRRRRQVTMLGVVLAAAAATAGGVYGANRRAEAERARYEAAQAQRDRRRDAEAYVLQAERLLSGRTELPRAMELANAAIRACPDLAAAYLARGRIQALEALQAALEARAGYVQLALADFQLAQRCAEADRRASPQPGAADPATPLVYALAAQRELLTLSGQHEAARAIRLQLESLPGAMDLLRARPPPPIYSIASDPLIDLPAAEPPETAHLDPDVDAVLHRILPAAVADLHPIRTIGYGNYVTELLFDSMFVFDGDMQCVPQPYVVESEETSPDRLMRTIRLRDKLRWTDGAPLTARDVVFTWDRIVPPAKRTGKRLEALDDRTVRLTMDNPLPSAAQNLDFAILPQHVWDSLRAAAPDAVEADIDAKFNERMSAQPTVSNGPYRLAGRSADAINLERWPAYPGKKPYFAKIVFQAVPRREDRFRLLADGTIMDLQLFGDEFRWELNGASFDRHIKVRSKSWEYVYLCWNLKRPDGALAAREVRRALALSIDLDRLIAEEYGGLYSRCTGIFSATEWGRRSGAAGRLNYDPQEAAQLLDQAGWTRDASRGGIRSKDGRDLQFAIMMPQEARPAFERILERLREWWAALGVSADIQFIQKAEFDRRLMAREFDAYASAVVMNIDPSIERRRWHSAGDRNFGSYHSAEVDAWFDAAAPTADPAQQAALYRKIQDRINQDQPYLFLWERPTLWAFSRKLRGVAMIPGRGPIGFFPGPRNWWTPAGQ